MSLKQKTISAVKWTTYSTIIVTILQLIQISILARLLEPSDFGLMALVMVVIGFSQAFIDMGISNAIIHKQEITHDQLSTLYWINILAGVLIFAIVCAVAPVVSIFYRVPEFTHLTILVGMTFLIQPFGQQFMTLWQKEMRFSEIATVDIISKLVSLVVSIWFAYQGYGVYALVFGTIAGVSVQTAQFLLMGLKEHKPSFIFRIKDISEYLNFGMYQMGERTINYFNFEMDTLLIGKLLGPEVLGIYSVAKQLIMRPAQVINPIITKVTFPAMAKIQNNSQKLKQVYLKTIHYLSSINFPIYVFIFIFSKELVLILFGGKWLEAVPIVQMLAVWGAIRSTGNPVGSLLLAKGRANLGFWWNLGLFFYIPFGIYIGSNWGVTGVAWALIVMQFSLVIPAWYLLVRPLCGAKFIEYHVQILKPALIACMAGFFTYIFTTLFELGEINLLVGGVVGLALSVLFNYMWNQETVKELIGFVK